MTDWIEITALVAGPVLAVGLTLWRESRRQDRERRLGVMRQLLLTRANPADPNFSTAINLVPVEFGHAAAVMTAWEDFQHIANSQPPPSIDAAARATDNLAKVMMVSLGYNDRAASQVARTAYLSVGLADQRRLADGVLKGLLSLADSSRKSAHAATVMAKHVTGQELLEPEGEDSI